MINGFGSAKEQWFSSFMLQVEANCSWHRLFVDPLSRAMYSSKGPDFEYMKARRAEGVDIHDAVYGLACRNFEKEMAELESRISENDTEENR
ncbi:conjugal transfer ATP-binding protein TraC [Klebsiella oxytoca]|nr:conjugal transfer ATP-binding protein TraC [Klebsiella oxytoca]